MSHAQLICEAQIVPRQSVSLECAGRAATPGQGRVDKTAGGSGQDEVSTQGGQSLSRSLSASCLVVPSSPVSVVGAVSCGQRSS